MTHSRRKASERIEEIFNGNWEPWRRYANDMEEMDARTNKLIDAIIQYLDEKEEHE